MFNPHEALKGRLKNFQTALIEISYVRLCFAWDKANRTYGLVLISLFT